MKLISEEILPLKKRATCTTEEALSCLETLERQVAKMLEDPLYKMWEANNKQIESLSKSLDSIQLKWDSDEKDFDRYLRWQEKGKQIAETQVYLKENSSINGVLKKESKRVASTRGVKN